MTMENTKPHRRLDDQHKFVHIFLNKEKHPQKKHVIEVFHNFITFSSKQSGEKMEESRTDCKVVTVDVCVKDAMEQTTAEEDR